MRSLIRLYILVIFFHLFSSSEGQILDDTSKQLHNYSTIQYITEEKFLNELEEFTTEDSSIYNFEKKSFFEKQENKFQNLGNFGSPVFSLFYDVQKEIGITSGINANAYFLRNGKKLKFYNTLSPYLNLEGYLGGKNRNLVNAVYTRNVRKGWNLGFNFFNITSDKQVARARKTDRNTLSTTLDIYTHFVHKKAPYQLLLNFTNYTHTFFEQGGVLLDASQKTSDYFNYNNAIERIKDATNKRNDFNVHFFQNYQLTDIFQLYHVFDYKVESNIFLDYKDTGNPFNYDYFRDGYNGIFYFNKDTTDEKIIFKKTYNQIGIKGTTDKFFYRAFTRLRHTSYDYSKRVSAKQFFELFFGGYLGLTFNNFKLNAEGEFSLNGLFRIRGNFLTDNFQLSILSTRYAPPMIYQDYYGNNYQWDNKFDPVFTNQLEGSFGYKNHWLNLHPKVSFALYNNFLYFDTLSNAKQSNNTQILLSYGADIDFSFKNKKEEGLYFENEILNNLTNKNNNLLNIPFWFYNGRYFFKALIFQDLIPMEMGVNTHFRSSYYGNKYNPVLKQFYIQNEFEMPSYLKVDLFFSVKVDKMMIGIKWNYFNKKPNEGYFSSPYYPGEQKTIDLFARWSFFD